MTAPQSVLVLQFEQEANALLRQGAAPGEVEHALRERFRQADAQQLDVLLAALRQAAQPSAFYEQRITAAGPEFEQAYALLAATFGPEELDPRERFVEMLGARRAPDYDHPFMLLARCARVAGQQTYDGQGRLRRFGYAPGATTELVVTVVSGNYMSLAPYTGRAQGIGAIGHLVTREAFRRGQGHGAAMLRAFEAQIAATGRARGEHVELIALESQADSEGFWYKRGFRWPVNSVYAQPPLEFDPRTGVPIHAEVPETLMLKLLDQPDASSIDAALLKDAVRTIYENWNIENARVDSPQAAQVAREYVMGKVYRRFVESLPTEGAVPLGRPPTLA